MMNLMNHYEPPHQRIRDEFDDAGFGGIFGRRVPGQGREEQKQATSVGGRPLEEAVQGRHNQLFEELYQNEDSV